MSDWALICPKVSLGDLFDADTGSRSQDRSYRNRIDRKHVDFLLCDPRTVRPILGIELDDRSHQRPDRQERDALVESVFAAAGLPLARVPVRYSYNRRELAAFLEGAAGPRRPPPSAALDLAPAWAASRTANDAEPDPQSLPRQNTGPVAGPPTEMGQSSSEQAATRLSPPRCPECGKEMAFRLIEDGPHQRRPVWRCPDFPRCPGTQEYALETSPDLQS